MSGAIQRKTHEFFSRVLFSPVPNRTRKTSSVIIQRYIKPGISRFLNNGTTIVFDSCASYFWLNKFGYQHLVVNHSRTFTDALSIANINTIEVNWKPANIPYTFNINEEMAMLESLIGILLSTTVSRRKFQPNILKIFRTYLGHIQSIFGQ
ncbi:hypothetical protein RF11_15577 [Thelohanellus kitauei]|uniref:ISXO2-like transposase domain-containing protein n=1 Tax=Thelohanellus kitauei TaxID=669202 RepID=A0A0C2M2L0_THEKT|nr:hypothetical protein RF11_15577 [Thelohanellus kitauei]